MIKNEDFEKLDLKNKKALINFIENVVYLSEKSQIDILHNANWHLPNLVHNTFSEDYIEDICNRLDSKFKK